MVFVDNPYEGIAYLLGFGLAMQYPSKSLDQYNLIHGVYRIPS